MFSRTGFPVRFVSRGAFGGVFRMTGILPEGPLP
jgi:hypothetical protein